AEGEVLERPGQELEAALQLQLRAANPRVFAVVDGALRSGSVDIAGLPDLDDRVLEMLEESAHRQQIAGPGKEFPPRIRIVNQGGQEILVAPLDAGAETADRGVLAGRNFPRIGARQRARTGETHVHPMRQRNRQVRGWEDVPGPLTQVRV